MCLKQKKVKFKQRIKLKHDRITHHRTPYLTPLYEVIGLFRSSNLPQSQSLMFFPKKWLRNVHIPA